MGDLEFIQRCAKGDRLAWKEFLDKYSNLIYSYMLSVLRIKDLRLAQENTEDLFQEIFLLLIKDDYKKLNSFKAKNGCSFASWLRQVVINFTLDYSRKFKPAMPLEEETDDGLSLKDILADTSASAIDTLIEKEGVLRLGECIEKLDNDDKYFLELYINQGLTIEEIKGLFRMTRGAIDMRKSRLIQSLRECFRKNSLKISS